MNRARNRDGILNLRTDRNPVLIHYSFKTYHPKLISLFCVQEELATGENEEGDVLIIEGRMDIQRNDYADPGPNKGHDPKVPGTA